MPLDHLSAMSAFVRVVEAGSFTKAAETLGLPKPKVTRQVQQLEARLGVRLLHRTTRQVAVTGDGEQYYERAVSLLSDLDDLEAQARRSAGAGMLRVETDASLGIFLLAPALPGFQDRHPDTTVSLTLGNRAVDLVSENIDCALRTGHPGGGEFVTRIGSVAFVTCASPAYLAAHGRPRDPHQLLASHATIGLVGSRGSPLDFRFRSEGEPPFALVPAHRMRVDDPVAYVDAARAGLGIIQAPEHAVRLALARGELSTVLGGYDPGLAAVELVTNPTRARTARVRAFSAWVTGLLRPA
jgi:DNA-binding transcriptional LysR family regulator